MRKNLKHVLFWSFMFGIEFIAYIKTWDTKFWVYSFINVTLVLLLFYFCRYCTMKLIKKSKDTHQYKLNKYPEFWLVSLALIIFIGIRLVTDLVIFNPDSGTSVWIYSLILFKIALSFAIPALLFGLGEQRQQAIALLRRKQAQIEEENRLLLMEQNELSNEVTVLKVELIAAHEQLDSLGRKYIAKLKEYREMIRRMREDGDEWKDGLN